MGYAGLSLIAAVTVCASATAIAGNNNSSPLRAIKRVKPIYPSNAELLGSSACLNFWFTVTAEGKVAHIRLATAYPNAGRLRELGFSRSARTTLSKWTFAPLMHNGKAISVQAYQSMIYLLGTSLDARKQKAVHDTIKWLCRGGPIFVANPIEIAAATTANAPAAGSSNWSLSDAPYKTVKYTLTPDKALTHRIERAGETDIKINYCIDPKGRLANVVFDGGDTDSQSSSLAVLNLLHFKPRTIRGNPVWTCGLHTKIQLYRHTKKGRFVGDIGRSWFYSLSDHPAMPKFLSGTPIKLRVAIPKNPNLPAQAGIEVRFCVSAKGKPYHLHITQANPPGLFDRAALETVAGWHFSASKHGMCDIYQHVAFKIPHTGN